MAAIFKMAAVPTEFLDRRQWHHMKRPGGANSLANDKINGAFDSQKEKL